MCGWVSESECVWYHIQTYLFSYLGVCSAHVHHSTENLRRKKMAAYVHLSALPVG